jgi:hypothetical protein
VVWSLLLIVGSEGPSLISLAASHPHTVGVFAAHVVVQFESSPLAIAMEAWKPASLKAMPPQSNIT